MSKHSHLEIVFAALSDEPKSTVVILAGDGTTLGKTAADLDKFVNGETVDGQDVVIWYGAHFRHNVLEQGTGECHEVGPTLTPVQW